jgi:hypothetical protein
VSSLDWLDSESFDDGENGDTKGVLLHGDCDYGSRCHPHGHFVEQTQ